MYGTASNLYAGSVGVFYGGTNYPVWGTAAYIGYNPPQPVPKKSLIYYLLIEKRFFRETTGFVYRGDE